LKLTLALNHALTALFHFEDFTIDELWEIAVDMYESDGLAADAEAEAHLKKHIKFLYDNRDRFFGNARSIRKIVEKSTRNHELRMAGLSKKQRTKKMMSTLNIDDVKEFDPSRIKPGIEKLWGISLEDKV